MIVRGARLTLGLHGRAPRAAWWCVAGWPFRAGAGGWSAGPLLAPAPRGGTVQSGGCWLPAAGL